MLMGEPDFTIEEIDCLEVQRRIPSFVPYVCYPSVVKMRPCLAVAMSGPEIVRLVLVEGQALIRLADVVSKPHFVRLQYEG